VWPVKPTDGKGGTEGGGGGGARSYEGETVCSSINHSILSSYKHTVQYINGDVTSSMEFLILSSLFPAVYPEKASIR
jgi:hypothetical protein